MRRAVNFRLSHEAIGVLSMLEEELSVSKTAVVEQALQLYARKKRKPKNSFMAYAGMLSEEEGDAMLAVIKSSRHNKKMKVKL